MRKTIIATVVASVCLVAFAAGQVATNPPAGRPAAPRTFQALSAGKLSVLGTDGNLWLEEGPFGNVPPPRVQVDGNVRGFQGLSANEIYVLGTAGNLWLEQGPFGTVPPPRVQVDGNVQAFAAMSTTEADACVPQKHCCR